MKKRILAAILASMAVIAFTACDEEEKKQASSNKPNVEKPAAENTATDGDEIDYDALLSDDYFDGYEYRMLVRKGYAEGQAPETDSDDNVKSAVFRRNKEIEAKYGITITATESSSNGYETTALNSILAGDDAYDLILCHTRAAFTYAVQGAAYNINDIRSINLSNPWWSQDIKNNCDINGYVYVLDGDFSTEGINNTMCMFFNKRIFDDLGFDYPYETVKDGDWTFDEFAYYVKKGGADLDGNGVMEPTIDQYGFWTGEWDTPIGILYTGGQKIYQKNEEGLLELSLYSNKTVDIFDEFFSLTDNESSFIAIEGQYSGPDAFKEGRAMLRGSGLGMASGYRSMDDDFGILPMPKFTEDDEYASIINGHASLGLIPITVSDVERTGAITEALAAYGSKYVIPAFYDVTLKTKSARDDESEEMMDIIRDSVVFDIGYLAGGKFQSIGRDLARSASHDFASFYSMSQSPALKDVAQFNIDYGHAK